MKVNITFDNTKFLKKDKEFINKFIKYLQTKYPLKNDITIKFMGHRSGGMTSGSRTENSVLKILTKNRMNRDILRTVAHEWVHEYQRNILGRKKGPDIGGKNEDEANAFSGRIMKMFEKDFPELENKMYESKIFEKKFNVLSEQIKLNEKESVKNILINEMKKIGIDKLPYSYSSLQKFIDSKTMDVHYNKHYKGYVDKLNKALKNKKIDLELEEIVKTISKFDNSVRNNAGGAFNHSLFWKMLSPKKQTPKGEIYKQIKKDFGNIKKMKDEFNQAAKDRFGSGWAWLYLTKDGNLKIMSTPNQDNPLMNVIKKGGFPLLGLDVWEHAYYLKYQNKRDEYIKNFWDVVNWEFVNDLYLSKTKKENINESVENDKLINEASYGESKILGIPTKTIEQIYFSVYENCNGTNLSAGCIGKINDINCKTNLGILGGNFSEIKYGGVSDWSVINRFDTNYDVHKKILELYKNSGTNQSVESWMTENREKLFSNDGEWTKILSDLNAARISEGRENEKYAVDVIKNIFGENTKIEEMCSGDYRDRVLGQDLNVEIGGKNYFFQVKPTKFDFARLVQTERGSYYRISTTYSHTRYKQENVDFLIFLDVLKKEYAIFRNDHSRIEAESKYIGYDLKFYEKPYKSNVQFKIFKPKKVETKHKMERTKEEDIEFYRERFNFFKDKLKELGVSDDLMEMKKYYDRELSKLLK